MKRIRKLYQWTTSIPLIASGLYYSGLLDNNVFYQSVAGVLLILCVMSAVHHSEIVAHRVGEPFGTIILAVSITIIEVAIIISLMTTGGAEYASFARDTVYAAVMLILNGIVGLSLFIGSHKFHTQTFSFHSVKIALVALVSIVAFTMILPTFTNSHAGPVYTKSQLIFEIFACLTIYVAFIFAQTNRHREYFIPENTNENENGAEGEVDKVSNVSLIISLVFLLISLTIVVLLAKSLSYPIEDLLVSYGLPKSLVGIIIAMVILLPEGIAAVSAAKNNRLQTSLNLALGSALASIGLTIPAVSIASYIYGFQLVLGLEILPIILLVISIFTVMLSLIGGRSNFVYGVVLIVNLIAYIFLTINP